MLPFANGSVDYLDLWAPDAAWPTAADRVDVFGMPATWVRHYSTDAELLTVIQGAASHGMMLSLDVGPLPEPPEGGCIGAEGYGGVYEIDMMRRIMDLGGTVDIIAFDEPYAFGHKADGPTDCQRSIEQVAQEAAEFTRLARELNPDVIVGGIEPMWAEPAIGADDMAAWLDAYREASGEDLAFLHLDMDWNRPDWPQVARDVEAVADARGVPFGVIYYGGVGPRSDAAWIQRAAEHAYIFEELTGGSPDDIVFFSWEDYPHHVLPETDPATFTGLIERYFGSRTLFAGSGFASSDAGNLSVTGRLATLAGDPVAAASVTVYGTPLDGQQQTQSITGEVPAGVTSALILVRVNAEGAGPGPADIRLFQVRYTESGGANLAPDSEFSGSDWTAYGAGEARFPASDHGAGRMLQLTAAPEQDVFVDSQNFRVSAGAEFEFSVLDSVPNGSIGSGFIAVAFLSDQGEVSRTIIRFEPVMGVLGTGTTDAAGALVVDLAGVEAGRYRVRGSYLGDLTHWPSYADGEVTVG
jgi:hypothetical protein